MLEPERSSESPISGMGRGMSTLRQALCNVFFSTLFSIDDQASEEMPFTETSEKICSSSFAVEIVVATINFGISAWLRIPLCLPREEECASTGTESNFVLRHLYCHCTGYN